MRGFLSVLLFFVPVALWPGDYWVIAHRGGAALGAENTLPCIEAAVAMGVDAVEVDVHLTRDGRVVLCHDAAVDATTDGAGWLSEMSLKEVQALRVVDACGKATDDSIPTLEQVMSLVNGRCAILVEVKRTSGVGIEKKIMEIVDAYDAAGWVSVQSFSDAVLERFRELGAAFPLEKLIVFKVPFLPLLFDGGLRCFSLEKYSYVSSFNFHKDYLPARLARKIRASGKKVKVWTLASPREEPRVAVDGVIVDDPSLWIGR